MTTNASWVSQRVPQLGTMMADGNLRTLGRSKMSPLTVLVREAAQNSWDARDPTAGGPVRFDVHLLTLDDLSREAWRSALSDDLPPDDSIPLQSSLRRNELRLLMVSDRGTRGLGGPVRGGLPKVEGVREDYASFVLNSGVPRDTAFGGGTYGFGKGIFFRLSRCGTAAVYTRCRDAEGRVESRFIVCAVGHSMPMGETQLTGRHWWGLAADAGEAIDPLTGDEADALAAEFGMPAFGEGELGTTVAIVDPDLGEMNPDEAADHLAQAMTWNLWPKMLPRTDGSPDMRFAVRVEGEDVSVPEPTDHKMLTTFVMAYNALGEEGEVLRHVDLNCTLGKLALLRAWGNPQALPPAARELGFDERVHHVCLLRTPELVVKYQPGEPPVDEHAWYAGVFRADDSVESSFADAEPPTHDDWRPDELKGDDKRKVDWALKQIRAATRKLVAPVQIPTRQTEVISLGAASVALAGLIAPAAGIGASRGRPGAPPSPPGPFKIRMRGRPQWEERDDQTVLVQRFDLEAKVAGILEADAEIEVWGGRATKSEEGTEGLDVEPSILEWIDDAGNSMGDGPLPFDAGSHEGLGIVVLPVSDTQTSIAVSARKEDDED